MKPTVKDITFILPSYNTLNYLLMAYRSIRQFYPENEIIILDDGSTDGSQDWLNGYRAENGGLVAGQTVHDPFLRVWHNPSGNILGHTCTYDMGIKMAKNQLVTIFHSDMICGKNYLENMLKHWKEKTVVCATRIEPEGIYPPGKEKILKPFGIEFHEFKAVEFAKFVEEEQIAQKDVTGNGIFAPWLISKEDFLAIGGHDAKHFAPYPEEDADLFLRFALAGYTLIQSRDALCWHWISRGHRSWAKNGVGKDDDMFKFYQTRARRNYLRKWHRWMMFDENHAPIVHPVYRVSFTIRGPLTVEFLNAIEPWATLLYVEDWKCAEQYIKIEQPTTKLNLEERIYDLKGAYANNDDIHLEFTQSDFLSNFQENMTIIQNLHTIIKESSVEPMSEMQLGIFKLTTHHEVIDYSKEMVKV